MWMGLLEFAGWYAFCLIASSDRVFLPLWAKATDYVSGE